MEHPSSFSHFYRTVLLPDLEKYERRRRWRLPLTVTAIVFALFLLLGAYYLIAFIGFGRCIETLFKLINEGASYLSHVLFVFAFIFIGIIEQVCEALFHAFRQKTEFSLNIVKKTVDFALPGMTQRTGHFVQQGDFYDSRICGYYFANYGGRDLFKGEFANFTMRFSWITAAEPSTKSHNLEGQSFFDGWFFVVDFPRNFQGETLVYRDVAEQSMGWFGRSLQEKMVPRGIELIHLEDADFERYFKVLSDDQLKARYILTPALMRKAVELQNRVYESMYLSFRHNSMYVAFPGIIEYFDSLFCAPFNDPCFTRHLYFAVRGVYELAEHLSSNYIMWEDGVEDAPGSGKQSCRKDVAVTKHFV